MLQALDWRMVGPYRGGRSTAVTGHSDLPDTFWMGTSGGGIWTTDDAGNTWDNITDGTFGGSVGSIDVADSDVNVIYVGTGSADTRGNTSTGRGAWKSTDGGDSWHFIGLADAGQIGSIEVDPRDADTVFAAALGHPFGPNSERGVFRSRDGGATWEHVLYVSDRTGAMDVQINPRNPREIWASMWTAERKPWTMISGSDESGIWRSTDGGDSWIEQTDAALDNGLPTGVMGKIGLAISPANPDRVWALIEATDPDGGVYRTDDAGASWERINTERDLRQRAWYYTHVIAHPQDENTLYALNTSMLRSIDGGRTFEVVEVPHGDVHDLWVNPTDPRRMVVGDDGGGQVTVNDGRTWSTYYNQATAELYDVTVDNGFPYRLYAGQQDNTGIGIPAWHDSNTLHPKMNWVNPGGCETGPIVVDPNDRNISYGACYGGEISYVNMATGEYRNILIYPQLQAGRAGRDLKYRFQWVAPILISQHDSNVVYHASNFLHRTTDAGFTWETISPDLTTDDPEHQDFSGGPIHHDITGVEMYGTIFALAESPRDANELWVGSDDGRVHISRDSGASWADVTPEGMPALGTVDEIELSQHAPGRAIMAVQRYRMDDYAPYIYATNDWGASWNLLTDGNGIPEDHPVRTVREDPVVPGLLYAGTEFGVFVSFDDGAHWQSLQLDLPITPVTGVRVHEGDLVISTQGRSFWILDDMTPLRELAAEVSGVHLFAPRPAWRANMGGATGDTPLDTAPQGATLHYSLTEEVAAATTDSPLRLEIVDAGGAVVRAFTSADDDEEDGDPLSTTAGLNRFVWDLQHESPQIPDDVQVWGYAGGPKAAPGTYTVRLSAPGAGDAVTVGEATLEVRLDPRLDDVTDAQLAEQLALAVRLRDTIQTLADSVVALRTARDQVEAAAVRATDVGAGESVAAAAAGIVDELTAIEALLHQPAAKGIQDLFNYEPQLMSQFASVYGAVTGPDGYGAGGPDRQPTRGAVERTQDLDMLWQSVAERLHAVLTDRIAEFKALMQEAGVPGVVLG
jgi:photosystem II stability/assembly factor-like uncharacterized protein